MTAHHISTYWHGHYVAAAQLAYPDVCRGHVLAVGWKITRVDGTTRGGYCWPLVNGDHDLPVLHEATNWQIDNHGSCPSVEGDGLCLVTTSASEASSGGLSLTGSTGHVLVYPTDLARTDTTGKYRVPWCIDVDCFDPVELIRLGLSGANLNGANLNGANLNRANLYGATLYGANLNRANLNRANLNGANLDGANLYRATLYGANLDRANLNRANLNGANLDGANLYRATLYGANLDGANLVRANLNRANLNGATHDRWTRWPAGFTPPATAVTR